MTYSAMEVARFILSACNGAGEPIDNLRLQKLLYFFWIDYYKETGKFLFGDAIEAWKYGPVVPNVYYSFREYVAMPIALDFGKTCISTEDKATLGRFMKKYRPYSTRALIDLSHSPDGPWFEVYDKDSSFNEIPKNLIIKSIWYDGRHSR